MANQVNNKADSIFTKNWNIYNKIIDHNYMFHTEWLKQADVVFKSLPQLTRLHGLDLGCGDAALLSKLLAKHNVAEYVGYDTSSEVLQYAAASLSDLTASHRLVNDYLQRSVTNEPQPFNFICSSYAIHHLQDEEKIDFFTSAYDRLLNDGGVFIYTDVLRTESETRNQYLDAYMQRVATGWTALNSHELALVEEHIRAYDFPAEKRMLTALLTSIGFTVAEPLVTDGVHSTLVLRK